MAFPRTTSVVIIGGGVVGCSIACRLAGRGLRDVVVLARESIGSGTTSKAAGGIRAQFPTEAELRFSLDSTRMSSASIPAGPLPAGFDRIQFERQAGRNKNWGG